MTLLTTKRSYDDFFMIKDNFDRKQIKGEIE